MDIIQVRVHVYQPLFSWFPRKKNKLRWYPQQHAVLFLVLENPRGTLPQGLPGPPRSLSGLRLQSFQLLGEKRCRDGLLIC